jgi:elongation factor 2
MVNFTIEQIRALMDLKHHIRNISVIAHVDHGKSTLTDSLVSKAGIIAGAKAGEARFTDTRQDEQDRCITIKSTAISLYYTMSKDDFTVPIDEKAIEQAKKREEQALKDLAEKADKGDKGDEENTEEKKEEVNVVAPIFVEGQNSFLINLIDSPGHVDFSSEVTAALRVTDGALVVVDCIEGVCVQTETVLRQAISEKIKPIVFVNKLDRVLLELHMDLEEAYKCFRSAIESANVIIETYTKKEMGDLQVKPVVGTVGFGSGLHGWGFTIGTFANMYAKKFGMDKDKMLNNLWGDRYWNKKANKWSKYNVDEDKKPLPRGYCEFILKPISQLFEAVMNGEVAKYTKLLKKLDIKIPRDAVEMTGKPLLKRIMQTWLPAGDALLNMIVIHLPSPVQAQRYRVAGLYNGPLTDPCAKAIYNCDADGPLMLYVSKMVPTVDKGRFYAFGRVFSGTVRTNQTVNMMGPDFNPETKIDFFPNKKVQRTILMMGRYIEPISDCPAGNIVGMVGVDQFLLKTGTITTDENACPFYDMKFSVSPVVRVAVDCKNNQDLPKLVEGLRRLAKSDPLVQCITKKDGEHIIAGAGELHLEICLKDLAEDFMKGAPIRVSEPVVSFCETVTEECSMTCVAKSSNKHNRLYCTAEPLGQEFCQAIDAGRIEVNTKDTKKRTRILVDEFKWSKTDANKIWCFGCPPDGIPNVFVDQTKGASFLNEIKDHVVGAFAQVTSGGVFCDEPMRGIRVNLLDLTLHSDSIHRGAGQIQPCAKKVVAACQIKSGPRLLEPYYLVDITVPQDKVSGVYNTLSTRRGQIVPDENEQEGALAKVRAYLPVLESFGFTQKLRQNTSGKAFPQMIFDHWDLVSGDPYEEGSPCNQIVMDVRKRKQLKMELPNFNDYYDKI